MDGPSQAAEPEDEVVQPGGGNSRALSTWRQRASNMGYRLGADDLGFGRKTVLQTNVDGDETMVDCPDSFFDPETFLLVFGTSQSSGDGNG